MLRGLMFDRRILLFAGLAALVRMTLWFWRGAEHPASSPPPRPAAETRPFHEPLVPPTVNETPDCPPDLVAAFAENRLILDPVDRSLRQTLAVGPDAAAALMDEHYAGPTRIWCIGTVSSFAGSSEPMEPVTAYLRTGVAVPHNVVLVGATDSPAEIVVGVAGRQIADWLAAQQR